MSTEVTVRVDPEVLSRARRWMETYSNEVERESWNAHPDEQLSALSFNQLLEFGVRLFESLMDTDVAVRTWALSQPGHVDESEYTSELDGLLKKWLSHCEFLELKLKSFLHKGTEVSMAEEFRKRHSEVKWILTDPSVLFDHPKFHELERQAIEEMRAGRCEE